MDHILKTVMCCTLEDEPQFHDILRRWIEDVVVGPYAFVSEETKKKGGSVKLIGRKKLQRWKRLEHIMAYSSWPSDEP